MTQYFSEIVRKMIKRHYWVSISLFVSFLIGVGVLIHLIAKPDSYGDERAGRQTEIPYIVTIPK